MQNHDDDDVLGFAHAASASAGPGPYRSGADQFAFADELEVPEDPLVAEEPRITYKEWAIQIIAPFFALGFLLMIWHPSPIIMFAISNVFAPIFFLYRIFAICGSTLKWWWQCRSWANVERRIESNFAGAGFVSLALLLIIGMLFPIGLMQLMPIVGSIVTMLVSPFGSGGGLAFIAVLYPPIARIVVRALFTVKNKLTGNAVSDMYEIELALFESAVVAETLVGMKRVGMATL